MSLETRHFAWHSPFGPYIVMTTISDELHNILLKGSKKLRKSKKLKKQNDYRHRLAGNLSEEYSYENCFTQKERDIINEELKWMASEFTGAQSRAKKLRPQDIKIHEPLWVNFMKAGEWNPAHSHNGDISCVMYLKVPKELQEENNASEHCKYTNTPTAGKIEFKYGDNIGYCKNGITYMPKEKDIFFFPAGLTHMVYPFKSKVERVSVSVNFSDANKLKNF